VGNAAAAQRLAEGLAEVERTEAAERPAGAHQAAPGARRKDSLSPREREVLGLLAQGRTNKQIAEELIVAEVTARYHVGSLLNKLGADNRTQVVALALERGLV
jgi:DNA-binding NarL/FixJ family response regulator